MGGFLQRAYNEGVSSITTSNEREAPQKESFGAKRNPRLVTSAGGFCCWSKWLCWVAAETACGLSGCLQVESSVRSGAWWAGRFTGVPCLARCREKIRGRPDECSTVKEVPTQELATDVLTVRLPWRGILHTSFLSENTDGSTYFVLWRQFRKVRYIGQWTTGPVVLCTTHSTIKSSNR